MHPRFTLDSARRMLPQVRAWLGDAMRARQELEGIRRAVDAFSAKAQMMGGITLDAIAVDRWQAGVRQASALLQEALGRLGGAGVQVKDLETGLVDFPTMYRGREVLLCWKWGEPDIAWWHETDGGFRGRKPLDEDFQLHHGDGGPPEA